MSRTLEEIEKDLFLYAVIRHDRDIRRDIHEALTEACAVGYDAGHDAATLEPSEVSRLAALREALGRLEWSFRQTALRNGGTIYTATLCPACMGEKDPPDDKGSPRRRGDPLPPAGHKVDCWLQALLTNYEPTPICTCHQRKRNEACPCCGMRQGEKCWGDGHVSEAALTEDAPDCGCGRGSQCRGDAC